MVQGGWLGSSQWRMGAGGSQGRLSPALQTAALLAAFPGPDLQALCLVGLCRSEEQRAAAALTVQGARVASHQQPALQRLRMACSTGEQRACGPCEKEGWYAAEGRACTSVARERAHRFAASTSHNGRNSIAVARPVCPAAFEWRPCAVIVLFMEVGSRCIAQTPRGAGLQQTCAPDKEGELSVAASCAHLLRPSSKDRWKHLKRLRNPFGERVCKRGRSTVSQECVAVSIEERSGLYGTHGLFANLPLPVPFVRLQPAEPARLRPAGSPSLLPRALASQSRVWGIFIHSSALRAHGKARKPRRANFG